MKKEKINILMVDDQPAKLLTYEAILNELEENLLKAGSAREALEQMLKSDIAVVLMDVSMPDMDGFELAQMIRDHPRFRKTAIIFVSGVHISDGDRMKGYERGAVDYISVPVVPELLRAKVMIFAELYRRSRELRALNRELEQRVADRTRELEEKAQALAHANFMLAQKNQELDAIIHTAPDIIFSSGGDGSRDYLSERFYEYTGAPPGSGHGFAWMEYVHPDDIKGISEHWSSCVVDGQNYEAEYRLRNRKGEYRWFRARAVPVRDFENHIVRWCGTCSDIHESKKLEESIRGNTVTLERVVFEREQALRRLSTRLMTMQDEERRRIARELHDGLGQELVVAKISVDTLAQSGIDESTKHVAEEASENIRRVIQQVRTLSHLLHPPLLDEVGLISAVNWYLDGLTRRSGIKMSVEVEPAGFPRLKPELETAIFRVIQEALTNVFRHSEAEHGWVRIVRKEDQVSVTVRDDGKGVSEAIARRDPGSVGVGIGGMAQRVEEFGGDLRITNASPGTLLQVTIPLYVNSKVELATA